MERFQSIKEEIAQIIKQSPIEEDPEHSKRALKWLLKLNPSATEEQKIAVLAHDIDRAVPPRTRQRENETYDEYKNRHARRSARIIVGLMKRRGYSQESIKKVRYLVKVHEVGGTKEADEVRDADSISYFDYNVNFYIQRRGTITAKEKIRWMYERASERAKEEIQKIRFSQEVRKVFDAMSKTTGQ